jgi:hypothetical protein
MFELPEITDATGAIQVAEEVACVFQTAKKTVRMSTRMSTQMSTIRSAGLYY